MSNLYVINRLDADYAAQARKGTGTDLCLNAISDIECTNRLNALQEQARGQH